MKKSGILNQPISAIIAGLGHMDTVAIADAGLPIPLETTRIDLALEKGLPSFLDTLRVVLGEMQVERAIIAAELADSNPAFLAKITTLLGHIPVDTVPHQQFKTQTSACRAVIRTGEYTPYANIILIAGVVF